MTLMKGVYTQNIVRQMTEYTEQEEELARVEADIAILTHENEDYQERLRSLQMKIEEKRREITILESKIKEFENTRIVSKHLTFLNNCVTLEKLRQTCLFWHLVHHEL